MSNLFLRAALGLSLLLGTVACVPVTGTTTTPAAPAVAAVPDGTMYLASSDSGFKIPAVDAAKVPEQFRRQLVDFPSTEAPGTVIINPGARQLYFVTGKGKAIRYGIAVGKAGFEWSGEARVTNRRTWPTWTPPPEMIARKPELSKWEKGQPGGPTNPLGARALYLTTNGVDYGYRIHGTPDWWSIGKNASSGCIRMINQDVLDLYARVPDGAKVIVLNRDGSTPKGLNLPPPAPKKKKAAVTPAVAAAVTITPTEAAVTTDTLPMTSDPAMPAADTAITTPVLPAPAPSAAPAAVPAPTGTAPMAEAPAMMAPATPAPAAVTPAPATPAADAPACAKPLVNGVCPKV